MRKKKQSVSVTKQFVVNKFNPLTQSQKDVLEYWRQGKNIVMVGSSGVGKTFEALTLALQPVVSNSARLTIIRSVVSVRNMGFMPGDLHEKGGLYEQPYEYLTNKICGRADAYSIMKQHQMIDFCTTSFLRGITLENTIIVIDEAANMTFHELNTIFTRVGQNCRILVCGDTTQSDLIGRETSGFAQAIGLLRQMPDYFGVVEFTPDDVVRSDFVGAWCKLVYLNS